MTHSFPTRRSSDLQVGDLLRAAERVGSDEDERRIGQPRGHRVGRLEKSLPRTVGDFDFRYRPAAVGRPDRLDRHAFARGYEAYPGIAVDDPDKIGGAGAGDEGAAALHPRRHTLAARKRTENPYAPTAPPHRRPREPSPPPRAR